MSLNPQWLDVPTDDFGLPVVCKRCRRPFNVNDGTQKRREGPQDRYLCPTCVTLSQPREYRVAMCPICGVVSSVVAKKDRATLRPALDRHLGATAGMHKARIIAVPYSATAQELADMARDLAPYIGAGVGGKRRHATAIGNLAADVRGLLRR